MKAFREEDGKLVVYVQLNDILHIFNTSNTILPTIYNKISSEGLNIIDTENRFDYIKFDSLSEVIFFRNQEDIIDVDKHYSLSRIDLTNEIIKQVTELDNYAAGNIDKKTKNKINMYYNNYIGCKKHKLKDLVYLLENKEEKNQIKVPKGEPTNKRIILPKPNIKKMIKKRTLPKKV